MGKDRYTWRWQWVDAERITEDGTAWTHTGPLAVKRDDWLLTFPDGSMATMPHDAFVKTYDAEDSYEAVIRPAADQTLT